MTYRTGAFALALLFNHLSLSTMNSAEYSMWFGYQVSGSNLTELNPASEGANVPIRQRFMFNGTILVCSSKPIKGYEKLSLSRIAVDSQNDLPNGHYLALVSATTVGELNKAEVRELISSATEMGYDKFVLIEESGSVARPVNATSILPVSIDGVISGKMQVLVKEME